MALNDKELLDLIAGIWSETLGAESIERADSFYDLGGTSISAEMIASRICDALPVSITGSDVLRALTLGEFVSFVGTLLPPETSTSPHPGK